MVTKEMVAKTASVSHMTVSRVINGSQDVSEETRQKVLKVIKELNYIPNEAARRLSLGRNSKAAAARKTYNIGVVLCLEEYSKFKDPYFASVLQGIDREAIKQRYQLSFVYTANQIDSDPSLYNRIGADCIDGIILFNGITKFSEERMLKNLIERVKNIVCVQSVNTGNLDVFDTELELGAYKAVAYLQGLGHRRIGYIGGINSVERNARCYGYERAVKELGLEYDKDIIEGEEFGFGYEQGYRYMSTILGRTKNLPTAVFAASDLTAKGAMDAIRAKGLKVPEDISVIGFDDIDESRRTYPALTTIGVKKEELGSLAVRKLIEKDSDPDATPVKVMLATQLVVRGSCSAPKSVIN